jgi:hypothetical protein
MKKTLFDGRLDNISLGTDECFSVVATDKAGRQMYLYGIRSEVDSDTLELNIYGKDNKVVSKDQWEGSFDNIPALRYEKGVLDFDFERFDYVLRDGAGDEVEAASITVDLKPIGGGFYSVVVEKGTEVV